MLKTQASKLGLTGLSPHVAKQFYPPPADCVLYLPGYPPGGATIIDHSGQGNHGTITEAVWARLPSGLWVLSFDGTDDYVDFGNDSSLDASTGLTLLIWVKFRGLKATYQTCFGKGTSYMMLYRDDEDKLYFFLANGSVYAYSNALSLSLNVWYLLACVTTDGSTSGIILYKNGVDMGMTVGAAGSLLVNTSGVRIGRDVSYSFPAQADFALGRVFPNTTLSAGEILGIYNQERHLLGV